MQKSNGKVNVVCCREKPETCDSASGYVERSCTEGKSPSRTCNRNSKLILPTLKVEVTILKAENKSCIGSCKPAYSSASKHIILHAVVPEVFAITNDTTPEQVQAALQQHHGKKRLDMGWPTKSLRSCKTWTLTMSGRSSEF
jgi:hypothetical protein